MKRKQSRLIEHINTANARMHTEKVRGTVTDYRLLSDAAIGKEF